ncbi:Tn3 family transposase, partial [Bdellovibrionota bacterium FG-2]
MLTHLLMLMSWLFSVSRSIRADVRCGFFKNPLHSLNPSCLSLLSNTVLVANTLAIDRVIRTHPDAKEVLTAADLARISPIFFVG